jgi:ferric-dicitrate binding protein FerR (iron transport regulator)
MEKSPGNRELFDQYSRVWEQSTMVKGFTPREMDDEWQKLASSIDLNSKGMEAAAPGRKFGRWYRIAAVFTALISLAAVLYFLVRTGGEERLVADEGLRVIELKDGSRVTLKQYAVLEFGKGYGSQHRTVSLSGEAFFEVQKMEDVPFIIASNQVNIEVLGTSFNVRAIDHSGSVIVTVNTGKVALYQKSKPDERSYILPGQKGVFVEVAQEVTVEENQDQNYLAWKTKELIFEDMSLDEVIATLNQVYESRIVLVNKEIASCTLNARFSDQSLESVLKVITTTLDIDMEKKGDRILLSGAGC